MIKEHKKTGILYRKWAAASPKAALLLVHGLGTHSDSWKFTGDFFLKRNISSYAIELRGFGQTKGLKGHVDSFNTYYKDIKALRELIIKENGNIKVFLAGQSMGGVIVFTASALYPRLFDGVICIAPAFMAKLKFSALEYADIFTSFFYNGKKNFNLPFSTEMCTRDSEHQKTMDSDPREIRFATSNLLVSVFLAGLQGSFLKNRIESPVLFLLAGEDTLVSSGVCGKIFKGLKVKDKTLIEYPGMYHALNVELGREKVFEDIFKWIKARS